MVRSPFMVQGALYAHTPRLGETQWHELTEHSRAVATMCGEFAEAFGAGKLATSIGWAHDAGKADPRFQQYLRDVYENRPFTKCPHAFAGAVAAYERISVLALVVAGHHAGLPNSSDWLSRVVPGADPKSVEAARSFLSEFAKGWDSGFEIPDWARQAPLSAELFIRMVFSCLIDADRLDTEAHMEQSLLPRGSYPDLTEYQSKLKAYLQRFSSEGKVNEIRKEILNSCIKSADHGPGVFALTVPTGGGKTLSGLAFALDHAVRNSQRRVIVAIPFTSIIDQTANEYTKVFGQQNVLEHHSAIEVDESEESTTSEVKRRLAAENWDCPLVVTTTVQLFESLLSNKPYRCRKLHRIANSVLVIDEVQSLPEKHLGPILDVLTELVKNYGVTVVLSTATPQDYSSVDSRLLKNAVEIVPDYEKHFAELRRAQFEICQEPMSLEKLLDELGAYDQVLVILNSRRDAAELANAARELDGIFHLSTRMCVHHRKRVLEEIKARLTARLPVRLVSTQVVEAGVDIDFPRVYRAMAPLDSIIQAAGRCNREGKLEGKGLCVIFNLQNEHAPAGGYRTGTALTQPYLDRHCDDLTLPFVTKAYAADYFQRVETGAENKQNKAVIQKRRKELAFKTVAENFRMIEQNTLPLVVESYLGHEVLTLLAEWSEHPRTWYRKVAQFSVSLYEDEVSRLRRSGLVKTHDSGALVYTGSYDDLLGVPLETLNPDQLIA